MKNSKLIIDLARVLVNLLVFAGIGHMLIVFTGLAVIHPLMVSLPSKILYAFTTILILINTLRVNWFIWDYWPGKEE